MKRTVVSAVQMRSISGEPELNLAAMKDRIEKAVSAGSDIICFPEACLTGYCSSEPFSINVESDLVKDLGKTAVDRHIAISFGFIEESDGDAFLSNMIASPDGRKCVHRKAHLGYNEDNNFTKGSDFKIIHLDTACVGALLCVESHFPEASGILRGEGAELILFPYSSGSSGMKRKEVWMKILPARAYDNGCFVVACNAVGDNGKGSVFGGGICIIDPHGNVLSDYYGSEECMITVTLDGQLQRNVPISEQGMRNVSFYDKRRPALYRRYR